jgi:hypothetical protein
MSLFAESELDFQRRIRLLLTYVYEADDPLDTKKDFLVSFGTKFSSLPVLRFLLQCLEERGNLPSYEYLLERKLVDFTLGSDGWIPNYAAATSLLDEAWRLRRVLDFRSGLNILEDDIKNASEADVVNFLSKWRDTLSETTQIPLDMDPWAIYQRRELEHGGMMFFIRPMDEVCNGCGPGTMTVVGGYAGHGKTTILTNMAYKNAAVFGTNSAFFTLEVPKEDMILDFVSRHSKHPRWEGEKPLSRVKIKKNLLNDSEKVFFQAVKDDWLTNPDYGRVSVLEVSDFPSLDPDSVKLTVKRRVPECTGLFVDYINVFKNYPVAGLRDPYERGNFYTRRFTDMSLDWFGTKITVVLAAQINRTNYRAFREARAVGEEEGYNLSCFAELNELEKGAYYAATVYSDEDLMAAETIKVQLLKHRGGATLTHPFDVRIEPQYCLVGDDGGEVTIEENHLETIGLEGILGEGL